MWLTKCTEAWALNWVSGGVVLNWVLEGSSGKDAVASGLSDIIHEIMFVSYSCSHKTHHQRIDMMYSRCVAQWTAGCLLVGSPLCSKLNTSTTTGWIVSKVCTNVHIPKGSIPKDLLWCCLIFCLVLIWQKTSFFSLMYRQEVNVDCITSPRWRLEWFPINLTYLCHRTCKVLGKWRLRRWPDYLSSTYNTLLNSLTATIHTCAHL